MIAIKSALLLSLMMCSFFQASNAACPEYGKVYGNCGSDIGYGLRNIRDWKECAQKCQEVEPCVAWTWAWPNDSRCYLYNSKCGFKDSVKISPIGTAENGISGTSDCVGNCLN